MSQNEPERLKAVNRYLNLEISKKNELQDIVNTAAEICETSTALISLVDDNTQYIKFKIGFDLETIPRSESFCTYAIEQYDTMVVHDALIDERFMDNSLVTGSPNIRFYAGTPLTTLDGYNLGILCVIDQDPKHLNQNQQQMLRILSKQVINLLEFDASLNIMKEQFTKAKTSEIKLRSFFESSISCHMLIGKNFELLDFNQSLALFVERIYHKKIEIGMKVTDIIDPFYMEGFINNYNKALNGSRVHTERKIKNEDEWWYIIYDPAVDSDGEIIGVSYNAIDVSKRVEQEQKIIEQNELLRKIAEIQSHELRRPVASILGLMNIFRVANYVPTKDELIMLEKAVNELDQKIRLIIDYTN